MLTTAPVVLVELDGAQWNPLLNRAALWLDNRLLVQSAYRQLREDTAGEIADFHL